MSSDPLLSVRNLTKHYPITEGLLRKEVGRVRAVDGISFDVARGETVGIDGESGCGKSTAATSLLRLEDPTDGQVVFDGDDITTYDDAELKRFRREAQMIFQDPSASFDPRMSIGESIAEPLVIHGVSDRERRRRIVENLLERVGLSADAIDRYPHEFSGGQKQRMAIARALVVNPDLIVADEPTSALDVSIQAEILTLIDDIQQEFDLSIVFISHDMGVIREVCDRVAVMYLGEIVELAPTEELFEDPQHPYTEALLSSIPQPDPRATGMGIELTGDVPSPSNPPAGCRFHTRCHRVIQPDGYDFEQENWRAVMDLRERVGNGEVDLDAAREFAATEFDAAEEDVTGDQLGSVIRDEFDIPETLTDPGADEVLTDAMDRVVAGDLEGANSLLSEEFATFCESDTPEQEAVADGHVAACHLVADRASVADAPADD
ncbi:MAG: ABC transporter ATP-binding protein [Haloarculaceae archaeon]